ncbi:MAG: 2-hydroxyglutaryl-CoA dehydratase [Ruminococcaceae bacterium]|nr:2-hydroxyglutaryl-CoA dehydratase [Oscillospiraceae bacterium]
MNTPTTAQITQNGENYIKIGIDIGSTTAKIVIADGDKVLFERYERHFSMVRAKTLELVRKAAPYLESKTVKVAISGSAGLGLAEETGIPFVQEVFATAEMAKSIAPDVSVVIELGGEDAKIIFFKGGIDQRMNGTCAGGTGAFIDQMATLLNVTPDELDELSLDCHKIYPIASRCGVFAKTDIQPLLNQGARKEDIAASIYQSVVNQTIAGLAQGRKIEGKVMFLGGPISFNEGLKRRFVETLGLSKENTFFPTYAKVSVALGAAIYASKQDVSFTYEELCSRIEKAQSATSTIQTLEPLFNTKDEYIAFSDRHKSASVEQKDISSYSGNAYLGIDCGSTTTKLVLVDDECNILYSFYDSNKGEPVEIVRAQLEKIYSVCGDRIKICASGVTGYGEELIKNAFGIDFGIVETMAHFGAAKHFRPDVDFILDIGGQDIKCFKVRNNSIDSIMLNEACSSGCGSFLETFAKSLGYSISDFSKMALFAKKPVQLGTRCTVFMNSSVKQAQKDGAEIADISAGLSVSVVKNAIYKVIRANSAEELGKSIVVQGGTFYNDAVLRAFEKEIGHDVIRPSIAGLMGAFGAALYAKDNISGSTTTITSAQLSAFSHTAKSATCRGCTNNCSLTVNTFSDGRKFISGNKCEKGLGESKTGGNAPNVHQFKRNYILSLERNPSATRSIGFPLALGMYELAPFWHAIFTKLGFDVILSGMSTREIYSLGQNSIPSDTACYPAKIMHGHIEKLICENVGAIFYPCLTYNFDEKSADNHFNCPVVAYYSELLYGNMDSLKEKKFLYPYLNIEDKKELEKELYDYLSKHYSDITKSDVKQAVKSGYEAHEKYMNAIENEGRKAIEYARNHGKRILVLAGRPYNIDMETGHSIDKLCESLGFVVVSEDSVWKLAKEKPKTRVLNQWTYHSRLYNAARFVCENSDAELCQLVYFGCGVDAVTTDETRDILENGGKLYTQIKIDEITNMGAVKIRLRSLIGALDERGTPAGNSR